MVKKHVLAEAGSPSSPEPCRRKGLLAYYVLEGVSFVLAASRRARPLLAREAYIQYVSMAKGRERRWRLFSTFPFSQKSPGASLECSKLLLNIRKKPSAHNPHGSQRQYLPRRIVVIGFELELISLLQRKVTK